MSSSCKEPISVSLDRKCLVSLMWLGSLETNGRRILSTVCEILSVGESMPETMGRPGVPGLWILGNK